MDSATENKTLSEDWQQGTVATESDAKEASKPKAATIVTPNYKTKFPKIDDNTICSYATFLTGTTGQYQKHWSLNPNAKRYVEDAKNRGLTCGVGEPATRLADANKKDAVDNQKAVINDLTRNRALLPANSSFVRTAWPAQIKSTKTELLSMRQCGGKITMISLFDILLVVFEADWVG